MMHRPRFSIPALAVALSFASACSREAAAPTAPAADAAPAPAPDPSPLPDSHDQDPAAAPATTPVPEDTAAATAEAETAYRAVIDAYNRADAAAYRDAFLDPVACFYGEADRPRVGMWNTRKAAFDAEGSAGLFSGHLEVLEATSDEVVLLDHGAWWAMRSEERASKSKRGYMLASSDPIAQGTHSKVIVMRKVEGTWRIAAETGRDQLECLGREITVPAAATSHATCEDDNAKCLKDCDRTCDRCGACNGCNVCPSECLDTLATCVGAPRDWAPGGL